MNVCQIIGVKKCIRHMTPIDQSAPGFSFGNVLALKRGRLASTQQSALRKRVSGPYRFYKFVWYIRGVYDNVARIRWTKMSIFHPCKPVDRWSPQIGCKGQICMCCWGFCPKPIWRPCCCILPLQRLCWMAFFFTMCQRRTICVRQHVPVFWTSWIVLSWVLLKFQRTFQCL